MFLAALPALLGASADAGEAAALSLAEGQIAPLSFEHKVERVTVSDAAVLAVRAAPGRIEVVGLQGGSARLTVELEGGASVAFDVRVAAATRAPRPPPDPRLVEIRPGEERRLATPGVARVMMEDNGVARARAEPGAVVLTGIAPGRASLVVVAESGARTEWTVRVAR
jgi:hypothetical protein